MRNQKNIKLIFNKDGALRDIYIHNIQLSDWLNIIDLLNLEYKLEFGIYDRDLDNKMFGNVKQEQKPM